MKNTLILISMFLCFGCSNIKDAVSNVPSEASAREFYIKGGKAALEEGQYKVNYFKKTNGEESADKKSYTLYYEAEIEFLKNMKYTFLFQTVEYKPGDKKIVKGQYRYKLTDNGWRMLNDYGQIFE